MTASLLASVNRDVFAAFQLISTACFSWPKKDEDHICAIIGSAGRFRLSPKLSYYPLSEPDRRALQCGACGPLRYRSKFSQQGFEGPEFWWSRARTLYARVCTRAYRVQKFLRTASHGYRTRVSRVHREIRCDLAGQVSELFQLCLFHALSHARNLDWGLYPIQSVPVRQESCGTRACRGSSLTTRRAKPACSSLQGRVRCELLLPRLRAVR